MEKKYDVIAVGMINFDVNVKTVDPHSISGKVTNVDSISLAFGGDAQNCAMTMARLGLKTAICGAVGSDMAGDICLGEQRRAGIDTSMVIRKKAQTGTAIQLLKTAEAFVLNCSGANAEFSTEDIPDELYGGAKVASLHSFFDCGKIGAEFLRRCQESGMITVADTTSLTGNDCLHDIEDALEYLDYFVPSLNEARDLVGKDDPHDIALEFMRRGVKNVVIKLGENGCFIKSCLEERYIYGYNIEHVVDTTGCGDNFVAGFIAGLVNGFAIERCAALANAAGAINATRLGSNGAVTSMKQLTEFMEKNTIWKCERK